MSTIFNKVFAKVNAIAFNPEWINQEYRFSNAVSGVLAPKLKAGEVVKSIDQFKRRIIFIGVPRSVVVVYDHNDEVQNKQTFDAAPSIEMMLANNVFGSILDEKGMELLFGDLDCPMVGPNIGKRMASAGA